VHNIRALSTSKNMTSELKRGQSACPLICLGIILVYGSVASTTKIMML